MSRAELTKKLRRLVSEFKLPDVSKYVKGRSLRWGEIHQDITKPGEVEEVLRYYFFVWPMTPIGDGGNYGPNTNNDPSKRGVREKYLKSNPALQKKWEEITAITYTPLGSLAAKDVPEIYKYGIYEETDTYSDVHMYINDFDGWSNELRADYLKNAKSAFWTFLPDSASAEKVQAVKKAVQRLGLMDEWTEYKKWYDYSVKADVIVFPYKSDPWFSKNKGRLPSYKDKLGTASKVWTLNSDDESNYTFDVRSSPPKGGASSAKPSSAKPNASSAKPSSNWPRFRIEWV